MQIIEEFKTLEGEGKFNGVPTFFIRTTGCNLRCSWKNTDGTIQICDEPNSSFTPEKGWELDIDKVMRELKQTKIKLVTITGGEPCLQKNLIDIVEILVFNGYKVKIETNGTIFDEKWNMIAWEENLYKDKLFFSISPKLKSSYFQQDKNYKLLHERNNRNLKESLKKFIESDIDYQLKFVVSCREDFEEIFQLQNELNFPHEKVYIMPQGVTNQNFKKLYKMCWEKCVVEGWNFTLRSHIIVWGNKRFT